MTDNQLPKPRVALELHDSDERVAILHVDRPPVNAFDQAMWDEFASVAQTLHTHPTARSVVISGAGKHFAAGADIHEMLPLGQDEFRARNLVLQQSFHAIATLPQITIAAVSGYALGGGCELALAADFRFVSTTAVFGFPEITLGIIPGSGGTQRLQHHVGVSRAKDIILSGRRVNAEEAISIGLADRLVTDGDVFDVAVDEALRYAAGPYALRLAKRAIDIGGSLPIEQGLALEAELITQAFSSEDGQSGLRNFVDNGPGQATFVGR